MAAEPTESLPNRVRMASTAAVTSCQDCSRVVALSVPSSRPSPRSKDNWSPPPSTRFEALTPSSRIPSPGWTPARSAAAT